MSVLHKSVSAGLIALTVAGALTATAPAAEARNRHHDVWTGVAAGLAGGIIGGAIVSGAQRPAYAEPEYDYAPPPPPVYHRTYYRTEYAPRCHYEWVENEWGDAYRARVCERY
ncbi:hypothetical protein ACFFP0_02980 [Rhizobium puerariae]|uniref:Lectin-like protein BA14k n=1 Tax=Rhizobium puerariae TaxID=1585791 RepID=A0ABV6AAZ1_9HYPH